MISSNLNFVSRLSDMPELVEIYDRHILENGEVLPHVLMGDVTRCVIAKAYDPAADEFIRRLLQKFEDECERRDPDTAELIGVSFLENLIGEDEVLKVLSPKMGPCLRAEMRSTLGQETNVGSKNQQ